MRSLSIALAVVGLVAAAECTAVSSNQMLDSAFHGYFKPSKAKRVQGLLIVSKLKDRTQFIFQTDGKKPLFLECKASILASKKLLSRRTVSSNADLLSEWKVCDVAASHFKHLAPIYTIEPYCGKAPGRVLSFLLHRDGTVEWLPSE